MRSPLAYGSLMTDDNHFKIRAGKCGAITEYCTTLAQRHNDTLHRAVAPGGVQRERQHPTCFVVPYQGRGRP